MFTVFKQRSGRNGTIPATRLLALRTMPDGGVHNFIFFITNINEQLGGAPHVRNLGSYCSYFAKSVQLSTPRVRPDSSS